MRLKALPTYCSRALPKYEFISAVEDDRQVWKASSRVARPSRTSLWPVLLALGKNATPACFIMPARIAATDPFRQINEYIGQRDDALRQGRMGAGGEGRI